jgi:hypothetical protein
MLIARYQRSEDSPYPFPNDDEELGRLDELQFLMKKLFGGNVLVPIHLKPSNILDIGTGSGCLH